jgi:hypothetical protein
MLKMNAKGLQIPKPRNNKFRIWPLRTQKIALKGMG